MLSRTTVISQRTAVSAGGCLCKYDPQTQSCCATGRCGCRKRDVHCGESCSCSRPVCLCAGGFKMAAIREVKKEGPSKGRKFFVCSARELAPDKCDFFCWAKNDQHLLDTAGLASSNTRSPSASWSCGACTFFNENAQDVLCEVCQSPRLTQPTNSSSSSTTTSTTTTTTTSSSSTSSTSSSSKNNSSGVSSTCRRADVYCSPCTNIFGKRVALPKSLPRSAGGAVIGIGGKGKGAGTYTGGGGGGKKRKRCSLGKKCPYIDEYQHGLEFSHNDDEDEAGDMTGPARRLAVGGNSSASSAFSSASSSKAGFTPFGGTGNKLGN